MNQTIASSIGALVAGTVLLIATPVGAAEGEIETVTVTG